jgi:phosphoketolase
MRAYDLVEAIGSVGVSVEQDILFNLQSEGLLDTDPSSDRGSSDAIRFTFERMSDHAMARSLLERSGARAHGAQAAFQADTALGKAIASTGFQMLPGLLEALAVQLPESFLVELPDVEASTRSWSVEEAFRKSVDCH